MMPALTSARFFRRCMTALFLAMMLTSHAQTKTAKNQGAPTGLNTLVNLQFKDASVRSLFELLGKLSGLNFVIDKDVNPELKTSVYLTETTVAEAIKTIVLSAQLQQRELSRNTWLIYNDSPDKQFEHREMRVKTYALGNTDAKNIASALRAVLKVKDLYVDEKLNMLTLRDTAEVIALADRIVQTHDIAEPEVMLEVEILEINSSLLRNLGVQWPDSLSLNPLASNGVKLTLRDLRQLSAGGTGAELGPTEIRLRADSSDVKLLANPRIRAKNREKARILIGERLPNINATSTATGFVAENVSYVEVGLKLDVESQVFAGNEIVIKLALEVSSVLDSIISKSGSTAYKIGTRNASTVLRLQDGENQILAGLIEKSDRRTGAKIPGLGDLPLLGALFGSEGSEGKNTDLVLSITPRLIRPFKALQPGQADYSGGTSASLRGRRAEGAGDDNNSTADHATGPTTAPTSGPRAAPAAGAAAVGKTD